MSFNRENVVWQSSDGSWNIGFFYVRWTGEDPEWDVEYDYDSFDWVSCGHADETEAIRAWTGANPGGHWVMPYDDDPDECDKYDEIAEHALERA